MCYMPGSRPCRRGSRHFAHALHLLGRMGAKKAPYYRIVVADSRFPRDGCCIEEIGTYDPKAESAITVDAEKAKQWIKNGAQPTDTVRGLLKKANVL